ncbi:FliH/SctL family protein [Glutamicibacter creatinolyticus]|uniref:FliH/SctL family protein n=1 Tax=Glutamicibacter creatinolyticus TaxID=162496 RepID=UPI0033D552A8
MSSSSNSLGQASFAPARFEALKETATGEARQAAHDQGYAAGYAQGIRAAEATTRSQRDELVRRASAAEAARDAEQARALKALRAAANALAARTAPVLAEANDTMVEAALLLAERIIGRTLEDRELASRAALERATASDEAPAVRRVRMNPKDLALLGENIIEGTGIALVPDVQLQRGDAIAEFEEGFLDARIASALQRASAALREGQQ